MRYSAHQVTNAKTRRADTIACARLARSTMAMALARRAPPPHSALLRSEDTVTLAFLALQVLLHPLVASIASSASLALAVAYLALEPRQALLATLEPTSSVVLSHARPAPRTMSARTARQLCAALSTSTRRQVMASASPVLTVKSARASSSKR